MKQILKNQRIGILSLCIMFVSVACLSIFVQGCSNDTIEDTSMNKSNIELENIKSIESKDLQSVLESVFQTLENTDYKYSIYINVCQNTVNSIAAESRKEDTVDLLNLPRLKKANPETVAAGWTYLDEVSNHLVKGPYEATKLYNKYKDDFAKNCVEMRMENNGNKIDVYVRDCQ